MRDVEARDYKLVLRGSDPMQVITDDVTVRAHENATKEMRIDRHRIRVFVHEGRSALPATSLGLTGGNGEWQSTLTTDDQGRAETDAWFEGHVGTSVVRPGHSRYSTNRNVGKEDAEWEIDMPDRRIRGTIVEKQ